MGSIVVSEFGGNHFHSTMFGSGGGHSQTQEASAAHHAPTPVRPSSSANQHPQSRVAAPPADIAMTDSAAPPRSSTPAQQPYSSAPSSQTPISQPQAQPPPSPCVRPQSQQPTPSGSNPQPAASAGPAAAHPSPARSLRSPVDSASTSPQRIKVKSLSHIQSFAIDDASPFSQDRSLSRRQRRDPADVGTQYEISEMPVSDIIEMVAGLLTKITTTNDRQHDHLHRQIPPPEGTSGLSQQTTSVLAFHGKNVPSISILSYLSRIHKYCPTTYEVFLSLLVYFDRMTERVNAGPMLSLRQANQQSLERANPLPPTDSAATPTPQPMSVVVQAATPPPSGSLGKPPNAPVSGTQPPSPPQQDLESDPYNLSHFFVVDSFNIHRLVIAGVTCASKFFSDVFYTNSRYAKVGGLPLVELNHLELQFLLLNDFRLAVPLEEMEAYGTMLVEFYAREVLEQHNRQNEGKY
ncbi:cyclin-domain-containing protein [Ophiobolus disseminans]|uniref:Cyclin-domain-containing protein n=1 Tax=Ophiobolus disseminans TaxID=1469910 RepID=A0A6A7AHR9_9PLEO|nr:cyclin-domain-containing protein [Ophiobolus disseminans]